MGELLLELNNSFVLHLHSVIYVPSLSRNLVSVSCLADDGYDCHIDKEQCLIKFNHKCLGLAFRQDSFISYLCMRKCECCMQWRKERIFLDYDVRNKRKWYDNETSLKLWHCRLSHISRGRIERLIKEEIMHPLDFFRYWILHQLH
jgi:hypothetical protein